jgi:hypothetical protein
MQIIQGRRHGRRIGIFKMYISKTVTTRTSGPPQLVVSILAEHSKRFKVFS